MPTVVTQYPLTRSHYNQTETKKKQIVLHHTAGSSDPKAVVDYWATTTTRVGSHLVLGGVSRKGNTVDDGQMYQAVDYKYWLWHLGIKAGRTKIAHGVLDSQSVGIEICNYGWVTRNDAGAYINYVNGVVPEDQVVDLGTEWRGYRYWHKYSDGQIATLREFIPELADQLGIVLERGRVFTWDDFAVDIDGNADKAVAFHVNFRQDKWDCSPQPNLIQMLNEIHA